MGKKDKAASASLPPELISALLAALSGGKVEMVHVTADEFAEKMASLAAKEDETETRKAEYAAADEDSKQDAPATPAGFEVIGYIAFHDGEQVDSSFDQHRECIERSLKKARSKPEVQMIEQMIALGIMKPEMHPLHDVKIVPVYAAL